MGAIRIRPFAGVEARAVSSWSYEPPFDIYDGDPEWPADHLSIDDSGYGFYAVVGMPDEVVGFCCFGPEARVRGQEPEDGTLDIGGGVRPDLVGRGIATEVLPAVLDLGRERFAPARFRTAVATFNQRSTTLCTSAGFVVVRRFHGPGREFQELILPADP